MTTFCVCEGGDGNGQDWNNPLGRLPNKLERGATYYVATGRHDGYVFDTPGDALIHISKATEKCHGPGAGWKAEYGEGRTLFEWISFSSDNWLFNGVTGGGADAWDWNFGFEILDTEYSGALIAFNNGVRNIEVKHCEVHFPDRRQNSDHPLIRLVEQQSDIALRFNWFHEAPIDILKTYDVSNFLMEYCKLSDNYSDAQRHGDGIENYGGCNWTIRYNWFENVVGTYVLGCHDWGEAPTDWRIHGNIFSWTRAQGISNGIIGTLSNSQPMNDIRIFHNSFINLPEGNSGITLNGGGSAKAQNNIWFCCPNCYHSDLVDSTYNCYINTPHNPENNERKPSSDEIFADVYAKDFHLIRDIQGNPDRGDAYTPDMEGVARLEWRCGALERLATDSHG